MRKLGFALLLISTTAVAQPKPQQAGFTKATTFESCTTSWAFACGMRDERGNKFGTAHQMRHCEKHTFQPNGTYSVLGFGHPLNNYGTYKMIGSTVRLVPTNDDGTKGTPFELVLSADGTKLGDMKRL